MPGPRTIRRGPHEDRHRGLRPVRRGSVVFIVAYFVGALANELPLPGGLGGVEGGTIGALLAFGTPASLAILAVLSYRLISFWLPTLPGAAAYVQLRRTVGHWRDETKTASQQPVPAARQPA